MLVSTKGRYALRTMMDLAVHSQNGPVKIKDIASRQEISSKYLEQIISILAREGLVRSLRGNQGGYYLSKENIYTTIFGRKPFGPNARRDLARPSFCRLIVS